MRDHPQPARASGPPAASRWVTLTETREDVKALLRRREALTPGEVILFRAIYPDLYDHFVETLACVVRCRGATGAVEMELVHEALTRFWEETIAHGFPESVQAKLLAHASGLAWNHVTREARNPATQALPTSSKETPVSLGLERKIDVRAAAHDLLAQLSAEHQAIVVAVVMQEMTVGDAAAALGIPRSTAASRLTAAMSLLLPEAEQRVSASERGH